MLSIKNNESHTDEKATDHLEMRIKPSDKVRLSHAANLTGVNLTTFVRTSAAREAARVLREHQITVLSERDRQMLLDALDNPSPPTTAAQDAVRDYRSRITHAG